MADPVLQSRPSTLKDIARRNESSALLLPEINRTQIPARIHEESQDLQMSKSGMKEKSFSPKLNNELVKKSTMKVSHPSYPN